VFSLDQDDDGIRDGLDNCPADSNSGQSDIDGDGAGDVCDVCPDTDDLPETVVPTRGRLGSNKWALRNADGSFVQAGPQAGSVFSFDIVDTHGCTCEQIIEAAGIGGAHTRNGCSTSVMLEWVNNPQ
jgi:hypothetical protein